MSSVRIAATLCPSASLCLMLPFHPVCQSVCDHAGTRLIGWVGHGADLRKLNPEAPVFVPKHFRDLSATLPRMVECAAAPPQPRVSIEVCSSTTHNAICGLTHRTHAVRLCPHGSTCRPRPDRTRWRC